MTYYFVSLKKSDLESFRKRMAFLSDGLSVENFDQLSALLDGTPADPIFFLSLDDEQKEINKWVKIIRGTWDFAKLIYVSEGLGTQKLKEHQLSPVGGDAYVHSGIDEAMLREILAGLLPGSETGAIPVVPSVPNESNTSETEMDDTFSLDSLKKMVDHPISRAMDELFTKTLQLDKKNKGFDIPDIGAVPQKNENSVGDSMSDKDQELSLDDLGELEIGSLDDSSSPASDGMDLDLGAPADGNGDLELGEMDLDLDTGTPADTGMDLSLDGDAGMDLSLDGDAGLEIEKMKTETPDNEAIEFGELEDIGLDLGESEADEDDGDEALDLSEGDEEVSQSQNMGELDLGFGQEASEEVGLDLGPTSDSGAELSLDASGDDMVLDLGEDNEPTKEDIHLSDDTKKKMQEIDALMDEDSSQSFKREDIGIDQGVEVSTPDVSLNESLVSPDLNLDSISFGSEENSVEEVDTPKKKKLSARETVERDLGQDLKEISGAYSGEMERTQATIANLRADRGELLAKIQDLEEKEVLHNRQSLTIRAELDERKIELTIIRKKLNEEIGELKDRLKMHDERRLILEEKNRILLQELDKAGQKNKIDLKKVQMRERELEQRLELLKSDAETQIRNRDLKILELKRKIDAMEFDMESISQQEKRSVESKFELEDKLDKAIKTLRSAISVLEDESDRGSALEALKKNIDM